MKVLYSSMTKSSLVPRHLLDIGGDRYSARAFATPPSLVPRPGRGGAALTVIERAGPATPILMFNDRFQIEFELEVPR